MIDIEHRPLAMTLAVVAVALVIAYGATWFGADLVDRPAPAPDSGLELQSVSTSSPVDVELFVTSFTLVVLAVLLGLYVRLYRQIPNRVTLNLILFVLVLSAYALAANPISGSVLGLETGTSSSMSYLPDAIIGLGVVVFLYQSLM